MYLFLFLSVFICMSDLSNCSQTKLTIEKIKEYSDQCIEQVGIDGKIIDKAVNTTQIPEQTPKYKDFLICFYKKQGYMDENGNVLFDNIRAYLLEMYDEEELKKIIDSCRSAKGDDAGDNAYKALHCLLENMKAVENLV